MPPPRLTDAYSPGLVTASKSVLLELMTTLRAYREALVLVGGWVPYFLLARHQRPGNPFVHVGSIDIDLAIDPNKCDQRQYATILELLRARGYLPARDEKGAVIPNMFEREMASPTDRQTYKIRVDFLTHQQDSRAGRHRHLPVQDTLMARKTKGCEVAFQHVTSLELSGALPGNGGEITVPIRMADVVGCLTMKGIVLGERYKEKDAYDIYAIVANYEGGPGDVANAVRPYLNVPLVQEAVAAIRTAFATKSANGPAWAATFRKPASEAERAQFLTDAYMTVHEFCVLLEQAATGPAASHRADGKSPA